MPESVHAGRSSNPQTNLTFLGPIARQPSSTAAIGGGMHKRVASVRVNVISGRTNKGNKKWKSSARNGKQSTDQFVQLADTDPI